jgi:uncharacterized protein YoaH (UPF0181 family)
MSFPLWAIFLSLTLVSCDKGKELLQTSVEKIKELKAGGGDSDGSAVTSVMSVDQEEGKKIIMSETRLVVLEFYSDT